MNKNSYLTLGGLFVSLHLIFILLSRVLVGSELILVLFLPLLSTIYALKFKKKEVTMFVIATFLLCFIFEPISSLIYVLPALICGTLYGELRKTRIKELSLVYITTMSHSLSLLISFLSISLLFKEIDFFSIFKTFIDKQGVAFYSSVYLVLMLLGLLESFLVHMVSNNELSKLGYDDIEMEEETPTWMTFGFLLTLIVYIVLGIINPVYSCYAFPFLIGLSIPIIVEFILNNKRKWKYIVVAILLFVSLFVLNYINPIFYPTVIVFIFIPFIMEKIGRVLYTFLLKYSNNGKNKIE